MTLWEIDIYPAEGQPDRLGNAVSVDAADLGLAKDLVVSAARGFLVQGELDETQAKQLARELFADRVVERTVVALAGDESLTVPPNGKPQLLHVILKPGVMDPVAQSALNAIADFGLRVDAVRTLRKFWLPETSAETVRALASRILANDSIEQVVVGPLQFDHLQLGSPYQFELTHVAILDLDDDGLTRLSREGQLYLTLVEMQTIQNYFRELGRNPTDAELESIAQTWSEHCSHKTLAGRIAYRDENGEQRFENMLKETIFAATQRIRRDLGPDDWCVSVFEDNAGIVRFDDEYNVVFKVETHNHPSALEPYGGANTGIGGVIRDPMGTGLGAKPIANTDVFCFAPPDISTADLPPGVLHPRRVMKGVVSGVRDYGNRMGIPTVNGAIYFDERYLGNPLVYCGNVGLIPRNKSTKKVMAGDWIVSVGGRTGRDGIHGATFSSAELTSESESLSGGAVQIGNAITEKMVLDVIMQARDRGLYNAVTDCGAGGFSSAVGEMGEKTGAEVWLDKAPLKYDGLSYTEIWISEAQERMVLSVPPENWDEFESLCSSEGVEASIIGKFVETGRLQLKYNDHIVADLPMELLHDGRPPIIRDAVYEPPVTAPMNLPVAASIDLNAALCKILGSLNVASKEWVIRQYDHEVQGGSVIKPLVGVDNDGPGDAAVVRPVLSSHRGIAVSCGMNPHYGDFDTYHMAASAIDEAIRNCVAVGADPSRISILDNFCWGYTDRPETLGSLVRAALACRDLAIAFGTPFISGKDSLNNEFSYESEGGKQTISIPPSLLISAMGQVEDVRKCVTMDLKEAGNSLYLVGLTSDELGGSHFALVEKLNGGQVPKVCTDRAKQIFASVHQAIQSGCVRSCHDLSEGGLAAGLAEMAFAGGLGALVSLADVPTDIQGAVDVAALFSESNSRFVCEVPVDRKANFERLFDGLPFAAIGEVTDSGRVVVTGSAGVTLIDSSIQELKEAWQSPLRW
ncbi:MAG: phosphoribosylformylglycinamidine synthase subunit PurL [Planctomycetaceae bacterium]|nr:phosphoribosylformylglycinamidine synthase subunit PurL [Planctomycetales bacterium]MCB9922904.1 phosphoribosylformylglycinamidine synthase subunit PurL [Planctomycetaceae bacterium]